MSPFKILEEKMLPELLGEREKNSSVWDKNDVSMEETKKVHFSFSFSGFLHRHLFSLLLPC